MLGTIPHPLRRQAEDGSGGIELRERVSENGIADDGIGPERQMRPVLLDCRDRENRDGVLRIEPCEVGADEIFPPVRGQLPSPPPPPSLRPSQEDASAATRSAVVPA